MANSILEAQHDDFQATSCIDAKFVYTSLFVSKLQTVGMNTPT